MGDPYEGRRFHLPPKTTEEIVAEIRPFVDAAFAKCAELNHEEKPMSFNFQKTATVAKLRDAIAKDLALPNVVKMFLTDALTGLEATSPVDGVSLKAIGHICAGSGSYDISTCDIAVTPIRIEKLAE